MDLYQKLQHHHQEHLIRYLENLSGNEKNLLQAQLENLDLELITQLTQEPDKTPSDLNSEEEKLSPFPFIQSSQILDTTRKHWRITAEPYFKNRKIAVVLIAGGMGSRLGFNGPKGAFNIGLPSRKSLFQIHAERLINLCRQYQNSIPWYIMTSPGNDRETREFFKQHNFFGYPQHEVHFFMQGTIPALSLEGKVLMQSLTEINLVPDGNGGCFQALHKSGILADLQKEGIEHLFLYGVDNALVKVCDPEFMGFHIEQQKPVSSKVVRKKHPDEKVGIFILKGSKPGVIEYSDLDPKLAHQVNEQNSLVFDGANIVVHAFRVKDLIKFSSTPLPYHKAIKKVSFCDSEGHIQTPSEPNALKFEQFMFDIFPLMGEMAGYEVKREEEFAPVKNASGEDSPDTAMQLLFEMHTSWLKNAGCISEKEKVWYEISPLISVSGEKLNPEIFSQEIGKNILPLPY